MHEQDESSQPTDATAQRRRRHSGAEFGIMLGSFLGVTWLTISPFASLVSPHASPQRQLAYGGVTYAAAIVAAVLLGMLHKLPEGLLRYFLFSLLSAILLLPALVGSVCLASALNQFAGFRVGASGIVLFGLLLCAILEFVVAMPIARRMSAHP